MKLNEQGLRKNISSGSFLPVYLIIGDESFLKQHYANQIAKKVVPKGLEAFNFHYLSEENANADEIASCVESLPMMCEQTCVLVHDYDFDSANDTEKNKIIELLSDLPDTCVLVFWMDNKGFSTKKANSKEIQKLIEKNGAVAEIKKRSSNDLVALVLSGAKKRGCEMTRKNANYFISLVGNDMNTLLNELDKLCAYSKGDITKKEIDAVAIKTLEATAFQMVDALLAKSFDNAFELLDILLTQKTEPVMICGALISAYVDMYRAKVVLESGNNISVLKGAFGTQYKSDFRLRNASSRSRKMSKSQLRECLEYLSVADVKLKKTNEDNRVVFEQLMIKLARV
ncbi:MAG: DNA polymerase III subunit delta [Acutalibacteraceae bacterium]|nr:DNA polymerase III subunit delta [Clostridiales bacterium]